MFFSGPGAYFSKPIFALKPWVQVGRFEYHEPYNPKNFFSDLYSLVGSFTLSFSLSHISGLLVQIALLVEIAFLVQNVLLNAYLLQGKL